MNHFMTMMSFFRDESAERVFDTPRNLRMPMNFHCWKVDNVRIEEEFGDHVVVAEDVVEREEWFFWFVVYPCCFSKGLEWNIILFKNRKPFVATCAFPDVRNDGFIFYGNDVCVAIVDQRVEDAVELPGFG